ncbi:Telomerase-binding protein EST1A [Amphibalanus amphitrite]|uniref:Telomerase-binding protein EST1A n=1 Tax=Amphibalanus amphitrite TaxID=1232801 RepID=A0A6A4VI21_AMPAM|nr:Telomerase-binding protein EST1A [Amphibalanus amphitrite]
MTQTRFHLPPLITIVCLPPQATNDDRGQHLTREVVLLTDDRNLRLKALSMDVPTRTVPDFLSWASVRLLVDEAPPHHPRWWLEFFCRVLISAFVPKTGQTAMVRTGAGCYQPVCWLTPGSESNGPVVIRSVI